MNHLFIFFLAVHLSEGRKVLNVAAREKKKPCTVDKNVNWNCYREKNFNLTTRDKWIGSCKKKINKKQKLESTWETFDQKNASSIKAVIKIIESQLNCKFLKVYNWLIRILRCSLLMWLWFVGICSWFDSLIGIEAEAKKICGTFLRQRIRIETPEVVLAY